MRKNVDLHTTLLIYVINGQVLLGFKNRGFGAGTYNGFGGKVLPNEDIISATIRESVEEAGITPVDMIPCGIVNYNEIMHGIRQNIQMHIFLAHSYNGTITPSQEMTPEFFDIHNLPSNLLPDTAIWLPLILSGYYIRADFKLNDDMTIQSYQLTKKML
ncbi:MAG: NUDIX domain-containing protein [Clostridia bacterium]|nr:NUDIX domain-containing protein [Clostridia bacterium]